MKQILFFLLVCVIAFSYYHYFVETLTLSEIVGQTNVAMFDIAVSLIDFDTGLTRYDLYNFSKKSNYWDERMRQVESIRNIRTREAEREKLVAEMLRDPALKKLTRKFLGFGTKTTWEVLQLFAR